MRTPGPRALKQQRSRKRSGEVVAAALRVFARDGIAGARIKRHCRGEPACRSPASIYDYFDGKQELAYVVPIVHQTAFFAEFAERAARIVTCRERLHYFLWMTADYARRNPNWARVLYLEIWPSVLVKDSRVRHVLDDYGRIMVGLIIEGGDTREWPRPADPLQLATIFTGSISHLIITWLLYRKPRDLLSASNSMIDTMLQLL